MSRPQRPAARAADPGAALLVPVADVATDLFQDSEHALKQAMRRRADGSWHIKNCRNYHVNSRAYGCAKECLGAQEMLRKFKAWRRRYEDARFLASIDARLGRVHVAINRRRRATAPEAGRREAV